MGILTAEEVEGLPEGARVRITWTGGNGPHEYVIAVRAGVRYAARNDDPNDRMRWYNPILFVGLKRFHTRVSLLDGQD